MNTLRKIVKAEYGKMVRLELRGKRREERIWERRRREERKGKRLGGLQFLSVSEREGDGE